MKTQVLRPRSHNLILGLACAGLLGSCVATVPPELVDAREAYRRASTGPAASAAPAELHVASGALSAAEDSFKEDADSYRTRDLAYVAQRKAQNAEATASIAIAKQKGTAATADFHSTQGELVAEGQEELDESRSALADSQQKTALTADQLAEEKEARAEADQKAAAAQAALARMAAVKEEPRGTVITLSGSVLFASNQSSLLPAARARLDQVADVLMSTQERNVTVEGHTDSQGSESANLTLSQRRADAVRDHLIQRGYQADLIQSHGLGEGRPVESNAGAEGRANNRRVEIIIDRGSQASN